MKGLKLEELWLEGNPLCNTFPDHSAYVRYIPANTSLPSWMPSPSAGLNCSLWEEAASVPWEDRRACSLPCL